MKNKKWLGIFLILLGGLIILYNAGVLRINIWQIISLYWPLLLIFAGIYNLISNPAGRMGGLIILILGSLFLANNLEQLEVFENISFWPLVLILFGIWILFRDRIGINKIDNDSINLISLFAGTGSKVLSENFQGGSSISIFGGADIDLSNARINNEAKLDVFVLFGGTDISVPENWKVNIKGLPLFGGWDNNTQFSVNEGEEESTLTISCLVLFGGIDVNN